MNQYHDAIEGLYKDPNDRRFLRERVEALEGVIADLFGICGDWREMKKRSRLSEKRCREIESAGNKCSFLVCERWCIGSHLD